MAECMELLFLGTGAADWDPALATADMNFRRYSAALLEGDLMIDCGPCVYEYEKTFGAEGLYRGVRTLLITHSHKDHFNRDAIDRLCREAEGPVTVIGDRQIAGYLLPNPNMSFVAATPYEPMQLGAYEILPLFANHSTEDPAEQPLHYTVHQKEKDKCLFWGCDGAWILNRTYHVIRRMKFDCMVFDGTVGDIENDYRVFEHNNIRMVEELYRSLVGAHHVLKEDGSVYISHMARTLHGDHIALANRLAPSHIIPARDGLHIYL